MAEISKVPSVSRVESLLKNTSDNIEHFQEQLISAPDDFSHEHLHELLSSIQTTTVAIVDFELAKGEKPIPVDPALTKRILACIGHILTKSRQEKGTALVVALNALKEFEQVIGNISPKDDSRLKRGRKVEKTDSDKLSS